MKMMIKIIAFMSNWSMYLINYWSRFQRKSKERRHFQTNNWEWVFKL